MKIVILFVILSGLIILPIGCEIKNERLEAKKIIILAGVKSHPATMHEYIKNARLIKVMLDDAPELPPIKTEIHYKGWPEDESAFSDADLILTISDGRDGPNGLGVPFMTDDRMNIIQKAIDNGCGFMTFHYSTFAPDKYGENILDWTGGYFDWQNDSGEREWYSDIRFMDEEVTLASPDHPVLQGVKPFKIFEEYYFDIRFRENDPELTSIIEVPALESDRMWGNVVAWAVERENGRRGFGTTVGHLYANWKNEHYRKFLLNAIVWSAGMAIPENGIQSNYLSDREVTRKLFNKEYKGLILTGEDHPAHLWRETSPVIKDALQKNSMVHIDISENINDLIQYDLRDYDFLVFNYANWENPEPLRDDSKQALTDYVNSGGSLMFIHFANGAFHFSLPGAETSDWPEYRILCRRVWDHTAGSAHDKYGSFEIRIADAEHELTTELDNFQITDELYYNQHGDEPIQVLLSAISKDTGNEEPMAWIYELRTPSGKNSRVFQTVLGHDKAAFVVPEFQLIMSRAALWLSKGTERWNDL